LRHGSRVPAEVLRLQREDGQLEGIALEPSRTRREAVFTLRSTPSFATVPLRYRTPADACFVRVILGTRSMLDADNLR